MSLKVMVAWLHRHMLVFKSNPEAVGYHNLVDFESRVSFDAELYRLSVICRLAICYSSELENFKVEQRLTAMFYSQNVEGTRSTFDDCY
jgi:hypothetical protein